ncbi:MAG TPA: aminotransferase class IV [Gammaproteobacteria bacterium]|nr:aminotransferase class IV [Gammaproteobacteria bacterium]
MSFASMTSIDGAITRTEDAKISVLDRGFLYGDSIYEVFRTYRGVPLFYAEHWTRFQNSAALIGLEIGLSQEALTQRIRAAVAATGAAKAGTDVYVRYTLTRGRGALELAPSPDLAPCCVIIVKEVPKWGSDLYTRGVTVAVPGRRRNSGSALDPNIKGGNYLNNVLALMEARKLGAEDCIMLDDAGLVTEASNSNVFFVLDGELVTPSQKARNLRGLTKAAVHEACREHDLATHEIEIAAADLTRASECFLTSATREVMPVVSVRQEDGTKLEFPPGGGAITRRVAQYYKDYVEAYVRTHAAESLLA